MPDGIDVDDFFKKYQLLGSSKTLANTDIQHLKKCRFCGLNDSNATFNNTAHALPELLGANKVVIKDECDNCNNKFSVYESHLSKFFMPFLTMVGVKGKRKVPTFHSRTENGKEDTRSILKFDGPVNRTLIIGMEDDYRVDKQLKRMQITFRRPPHIPFHVYKAIVKMGISVLPSNAVQKFQDIAGWLIDDQNAFQYSSQLFVKVLSKARIKEPFAEIYEIQPQPQGNTIIPQATVIFGFANLLAQAYLPFGRAVRPRIQSQRLSLELNLHPWLAVGTNTTSGDCRIRIYSLSATHTITDDEILNFSFQEGDFNLGEQA